MKLIRHLAQVPEELTRQATEEELRVLFEAKLQEKIREYFEAKDGPTPYEVQAERLADLLDTVQSLIRREGFNVHVIRGVATRKRKVKGDYDRALVLL